MIVTIDSFPIACCALLRQLIWIIYGKCDCGSSHCANAQTNMSKNTKYRCLFVYVGILIKNYGYEMMTKAKNQSNKCSLSPRFDTIKCGIQIECIIWNQIVLNSSGSLMWLFHLFVHRNSSTRLRLEMLFIVGVSYQNFKSCIIEQINEHFFRLIKLHKVQLFITFYLRSVRLFLWKFQIVCAILFAWSSSNWNQKQTNKLYNAHCSTCEISKVCHLWSGFFGLLSESDAFCKPHDIWPAYNVFVSVIIPFWNLVIIGFFSW